MMKLFFWGSGKRCQLLLDLIKRIPLDIYVNGIVDIDPAKINKKVDTYTVLAPNNLKINNDEYLCITFFGQNDYEQIWKELPKKYSIERNRILSFHDLLIFIYARILRLSSESIDGSNKHIKTVVSAAWPFGIGGVEEWIRDTITELSKKRKDLYVISKESQFNNIIDKKNLIDFYIEDSCSFRQNNVNDARNILIDAIPCIIICSRADEMLLAAYMLHMAYPQGIRIIVVVHGSCDGLVRDFFAYNKAIERYLCVSHAAFNSLHALGVESERIEIITTPVKILEKNRNIWTLDRTKALRLGYAGRLETMHKRSDLLITLIRKLEELKIKYIFEIAGSGSYASNIVDFISKTNLYSKVTYLGLIDRKQISDFWKDKDISINVSDSEGRPISNIEAMLCGVVPVVTETSGILDDVENGVTGYVVSLGDIDKMAEVIAYLDKNREMLKIIGGKAQDSMKKKTDINAYVNRWNEILDGK